MAVESVSRCNATTEYGNPYRKTNKAKVVLGAIGLAGMCPIPKSVARKVGRCLPEGSFKDLLRGAWADTLKTPFKKQLLTTGALAIVLFGIGALIDKHTNNKRANKADLMNAKGKVINA